MCCDKERKREIDERRREALYREGLSLENG
jgi:hypothetical protein